MNSSAAPTSVRKREDRVPLVLGHLVALEHLVQRREGVRQRRARAAPPPDFVVVLMALVRSRFHCAEPASHSV